MILVMQSDFIAKYCISYYNSKNLGKTEKPHYKFVPHPKHFLLSATAFILLKSIHLPKTFYQKQIASGE